MDQMIQEFFVTFGVQYGRRDQDDKHPLGMYSDGYAVMEAPDMETARRIAAAVFECRWAFIYPDKPEERHAPAGELMRIKWVTP